MEGRIPARLLSGAAPGPSQGVVADPSSAGGPHGDVVVCVRPVPPLSTVTAGIWAGRCSTSTLYRFHPRTTKREPATRTVKYRLSATISSVRHACTVRNRQRSSFKGRMRRSVRSLTLAAAAGPLSWGLFEAAWLRRRTIDVRLPNLPRPLDGLRIAHLSDFHLGVPSPGSVAVERAVAWVADRRPDLVAVTGDLLTRPTGEARLRELMERLPQPTFAVLGNHDLAIARDPLARRSDIRDLQPARLLRDGGAFVEIRGQAVWVAGVHPRALYGIRRRTDPNALTQDGGLRILLCHFPHVLDRLEPGSFDLVLAGHMHDGQITIPYPGGKVSLAHIKARYAAGVYRSRDTVMHVSPGLGTTFVPFRFGARPEVTELVLRSPR